MKQKRIKFGCSCKQCRYGRHTQKKVRSKRIARGARRLWNGLARNGVDEGWPVFSFGYTD